MPYGVIVDNEGHSKNLIDKVRSEIDADTVSAPDGYNELLADTKFKNPTKVDGLTKEEKENLYDIIKSECALIMIDGTLQEKGIFDYSTHGFCPNPAFDHLMKQIDYILSDTKDKHWTAMEKEFLFFYYHQ